MAILIKGDEIDALVAELCAITGEKNKSQAVRTAVSAQIRALSSQERLAERMAKLQVRASEAGFASSGADLKPFFDEQWGDS